MLAALLLAATTSPLRAQGVERAEKATLRVITDHTAYQPGASGRVAAIISIEHGWHVNSNKPTYDYLIPTEVSFQLPARWPAAEVEYPEGEMQTFSFADRPLSVYEGEVALFEIPDSPEEDSVGVVAAVTYQACNDRSCLPPVTTRQSVQIRIGAEGRPVSDPAFSAQSAVGSSGSPPASLTLMLVLGVVGGLILNAMPCVLPVLSLKVFGLVKSASKGRAQVVVGSLATAAGILLSFWALALSAVLARSAGAAVGWGVQFQEPVFVSVLAIIVLLFCLNLWGLFEIPLPVRLARIADSGPKEGIPGHLVSGLFATLMATPCSAPFLGTAVGFALSQKASTIFAVFTAIAVGMALPYLALAAAPQAARLLPKPGPWMDKLRVFMGFLLAGAAIWLFYVLAAQVSRERLAFIELALLALALFVWVRHQASRRAWAKGAALVGILLSVFTTVALAAGADTAAAASAQQHNSLIPWVTFDRQEASRMVSAGRLVFVDVTADWCFTCKVNEQLVLETPEIADLFESYQVVPMKADWTNRSDEISRFLADHGRYGIPFYLLYRPGAEPHLFSELLTKDEVVQVIEQAAGSAAG
jgi:suppressor for copper-sensitivity B